MFFSHKKLEAYKRAIEFVAWHRKKEDTKMKMETKMKTKMKMKSEEDMCTIYVVVYNCNFEYECTDMGVGDFYSYLNCN